MWETNGVDCGAACLASHERGASVGYTGTLQRKSRWSRAGRGGSQVKKEEEARKGGREGGREGGSEVGTNRKVKNIKI